MPSALSPVIALRICGSGDQVGVLVDERLPHTFRVIDVLTENDSLVETVSSLQVVRQLSWQPARFASRELVCGRSLSGL